jgi:neopullulanase
MTMPGVPCIYYGDEIGLSGGTDPDCRAAFPWADEAQWDHDLLTFYRQVTALRHALPALRAGSFQTLYARDEIFAFKRRLGAAQVVIIFNVAAEAKLLRLPLSEVGAGPMTQVWPPSEAGLHGFEDDPLGLTIPGRSAVVFAR